MDIIGRTANEIADELEERSFTPSSWHAFYLGSELTKAETALRIGRIQIT